MDFYCDIKVLPDPEASEPVLLSNLMSKLHRILAKQQTSTIGVSFPYVEKTLGNTLRLHGNEQNLNSLQQIDWLKGLRDYCFVGNTLPVPANAQYCTVKRVQSKSANNKRKRSIAKGWLSEKDAAVKISDVEQKRLTLPFVQMSSASTKQNYIKLFIEHSEVQSTAISGEFNTYGLSKTATVPWF